MLLREEGLGYRKISRKLNWGIKTVSFDPLSQYVDYDAITNEFPKFNAVFSMN